MSEFAYLSLFSFIIFSRELCTYVALFITCSNSYTIFSSNIFRVKCTYPWRRRFLTLSRNKWTFKLQPRVPPVVGARAVQWPPITDATTCPCRFATNSCHYIFVFASTRAPYLAVCSRRNYGTTTLNSRRKLPATDMLPQGNRHN